MEISRSGPIPPYQQIAAWLRDRIEAGEFAVDQPLPSEAAIVGEFGVARTTARRAIAMLRSENLVFTHQSRGTYVKTGRPAAPADEQ